MAWNWFGMANGKHIFRSDTPFGNFGLPLEKFRLFWKISVRANQNGLTIYIPTEISGIFLVNGKQPVAFPVIPKVEINFAVIMYIHITIFVSKVREAALNLRSVFKTSLKAL